MRILTAVVLLGLSSVDGGVDSPFNPGEVLTYEVTVLGANAGTVQIEVKGADIVDGVSTWPVVADVRSKGAFDHLFPLKDHLVTWWDPRSLQPVASQLAASEGGHRYEYSFHFKRAESGPDGGIAVSAEHRESGSSGSKVRSMDPDVRDFLAAIYWLRTRPLALKERDSTPVVMGDNQWTLVANVVGKETIDSGVGKVPCVHVRLSVQFSGALGNRRDLDAYFTDDATHVPVLLDSELLIGHLQTRLSKMGDATRVGQGASR